MRKHRIAAGGILFNENKVLLVRYEDANDSSYLVCPGGGSKELEGIQDTVAREFLEETGIIVQAKRVVMIEDLITAKFRMQKTWFLCSWIDGTIKKTKEAELEGIVSVSWYAKHELADEVVYPDILKEYDWNEIQSDKWKLVCNPISYANF